MILSAYHHAPFEQVINAETAAHDDILPSFLVRDGFGVINMDATTIPLFVHVDSTIPFHDALVFLDDIQFANVPWVFKRQYVFTFENLKFDCIDPNRNGKLFTNKSSKDPYLIVITPRHVNTFRGRECFGFIVARSEMSPYME